LREPIKNSPPRWVGKRVEDAVELRRLVKHML